MFKTDGLAGMAFPTLFPYGKRDPTNRARQREVTLTEALKHLMKFAECRNGKFGGLLLSLAFHIGG